MSISELSSSAAPCYVHGMIDVYRHFKGGMYRLMFNATDSETLKPVVIYMALSDGRLWTRPSDEFFGTVIADDKPVPRFAPVSRDEAKPLRAVK